MENMRSVGQEYLQKIGFTVFSPEMSMEDILNEQCGQRAAEYVEQRKKIKDGSPEFYEYKNQNIELSTLYSEYYDANIIRKFCDYLYENKDYIKGNILEIGCESGFITGFLAMYFPDTIITAVDINESAIKIAKQRLDEWGITNVRFVAADIKSIREQYDTVISLRTAHENFNASDLIDVFNCDELSYQFTKYRTAFEPYASCVSSLIKEGGHLISIERFHVSLLGYGWLSALNLYNCRFNKQSFRYIYASEAGKTSCFTGIIADVGSPREDIAIQKFIMRQLLVVNDDDNTSSNMIREGWPAIVYFTINRGERITDNFMVSPDGDKVGRFAAYYDKDDPNMIIHIESVNLAKNTVLKVANAEIKEEVLERIDYCVRCNLSNGFNCVPFDPEEYQ